MRKVNVRASFPMLLILFVWLGLVQTASGQNNKPAEDKDAIQDLLAEVRMLRQALQTLHRMNLDSYRSQLLVDRIRANREDIRRLTSSLNETRDTLAKTQSTIPHFIDRIKLWESQVQLEVDQQRRANLEFEIKQNKEAVERYKSQIEPMKEKEQQLSAELNAEKAKLQELESRLDFLERAIENDRQKLEQGKPAATKTP